jgi:RNA recognition motif-containing protein
MAANFFGLLDLSRHSSDSSLRSSVPRGPPRKPKQSGHALWVGNLPPGTHIADLKDHFSKNATKEIESVFLISKSNCAFVNYKSEAACAEAMMRFHDSRFQGVRLVCRLRRGSAPTSSATLASPPSGAVSAEGIEPKAPSAAGLIQQVGEPEQLDEKTVDGETSSTVPRVKEKFFVVKSLTVEDLDLSVRNGIWATQAHNEAALNKAYEVSVSVRFFSRETD